MLSLCALAPLREIFFIRVLRGETVLFRTFRALRENSSFVIFVLRGEKFPSELCAFAPLRDNSFFVYFVTFVVSNLSTLPLRLGAFAGDIPSNE